MYDHNEDNVNAENNNSDGGCGDDNLRVRSVTDATDDDNEDDEILYPCPSVCQ